MKEETKQKLNKIKQFVYDHEDLIVTGLYFGGCFMFGRCIGNYINKINITDYHRGFDQGMNCCFNLMMNENADKPEVIKSLVDFNIHHCLNK